MPQIEDNRRRSIIVAICFFVFTWSLAASYVIYASEIHPDPTLIDKPASGSLKVAFGYNLACCMLAGMIANYFWDLFRAGKPIEAARLTEVLVPLLISPIIFYSLWSWWPDQKISFLMSLIAFQNGFFWQVIFSKSGPITSAPSGTPGSAP
jgi:hypothetical protein